MKQNDKILEFNYHNKKRKIHKVDPILALIHNIKSPLQALQAIAENRENIKDSTNITQVCLRKIVKLCQLEDEVNKGFICIPNLLKSIKEKSNKKSDLQISVKISVKNAWIKASIQDFELEELFSSLIAQVIKKRNNTSSITIKVSQKISLLNFSILFLNETMNFSSSKMIDLTNVTRSINEAGGQLFIKEIKDCATKINFSLPI